jgi:UDP-glucose 4-epimerase
MRVLVTGGGGFVGAWIVRRLRERNCEIRVFDARDDRRLVEEIAGEARALNWRVGDISDTTAVSAAAEGCEVAIHLAAWLTPACAADPIRGAEINLIGTLNVFEAAKTHGMDRVVYVSSAGVFGPEDGTTPFPNTHYGAFKLACEGSARAYWERDRTPSFGFRPYIVYGPGRETGMTAGPSLAARAAARGEAYTIPYTGLADLIYVGDVVAAFEAAALGPRHDGAHVFNLPGAMATADDVVAEIHRQVPQAQIDAIGPTLPHAANISRDPDLDRLLPNLPRTSLAEGLRATIAYYS